MNSFSNQITTQKTLLALAYPPPIYLRIYKDVDMARPLSLAASLSQWNSPLCSGPHNPVA